MPRRLPSEWAIRRTEFEIARIETEAEAARRWYADQLAHWRARLAQLRSEAEEE